MCRSKAMRMLVVLSMILGLSGFAWAADGDAPEPEIIIAPIVPTVSKELELRLYNAGPTEKEISFSVTYEGKEVFQGKAVPKDGKIVAKWTPKETGFHAVSFDLGRDAGGAVSREFPVVWTDLYFLIWGAPRPETVKAYPYGYLLSYIVGSHRDMEALRFWKSRGSRVLQWTGGSQVFPAKGPISDEVIDHHVTNWSEPMKLGYDGIFMDEIGSYPSPEEMPKIEAIGKALVKLRKENPDMIIMPASSGAPLRETSMAYKDSESVALLESYPTSFTKYFASHSVKRNIDYRIEVARNTDLIHHRGRRHGAVILLGTHVTGAHEEPVIAEIEDLVRHIKKTAPEMPGIAFWGARAYHEQVILADLNRICLEYYIKPVVDMRNIRFSSYSPRAGEPVDVLLNIHNLGGMQAKGVRLKVYARRVTDGKAKVIGQTDIQKIGCGWRNLEFKGKEEEDEKGETRFEFQEVNGNRYAVFPKTAHNSVFLPRTTRKVTWTPKKKGYYEIIAEVEPSEQYTILDGVLRQTIQVR